MFAHGPVPSQLWHECVESGPWVCSRSRGCVCSVHACQRSLETSTLEAGFQSEHSGTLLTTGLIPGDHLIGRTNPTPQGSQVTRVMGYTDKIWPRFQFMLNYYLYGRDLLKDSGHETET